MNTIFGYKILNSEYPQMKIIETPDFILRPATLNDTHDLHEYLRQENVVKYLPFKAHKNINATKKFIQSFFIENYEKGKIGNYVIYYKPDKKVIGNIGINNVSMRAREGEIGICINPKYWGNNFATELTVITLITGFELMNLDKLIAITYSENRYTPKSLKALGFKYVKTRKLRNTLQVSHIFELSRNDYLQMKEYYLPCLIMEFY
ncbi:GNAT family N-acetyltransferase [Terrisporobacter sp.]|uniref:GNAT family N-acetyltransferase n=1 Tax=Terrisporobacter sp. TaxID=1965305 RepID=UPI00260E6588|nr:GNAT family N-acetyltransferase [Terrisporobacter sp.]